MRPLAGLICVAGLAGGAAGHAGAASLALDGAWGNAAGCAMQTGAASTEEAVLLTSDRFDDHEGRCEFLDVKASRTGTQVVRMFCEGADSFRLRDLIVQQDQEGPGLTLHFGMEREPMRVEPCG